MTDLAQDLLSSFLVAESQLNGSRNLGVVSLRKKAIDRFEKQGFLPRKTKSGSTPT